MLAKEIKPFFQEDSPLSISIFRCTRQIPHYHSDVFELILCLKGQFEVRCMHEQHVLHPGDILQADMFDIHTISAVDSEEPDNLVVSFHIDLNHPLFANDGYKHLFYVCSSDNSSPSQKKRINHIRLLLLTILDSYLHNRLTDQIPLMTNEILQIMRNYFQYFDHINGSGEMFTKEMKQRFENIMSYMLAHYDERVTMRDICDAEHISYNYLSRFFKDSSLKTFRAFLHEIRVYHSEHLLLCHPELSVSDISYRIGFSDPRLFYREFRKKYGHTPHQHRICYRKYNEHAVDDTILDVENHLNEIDSCNAELFAQTAYLIVRENW